MEIERESRERIEDRGKWRQKERKRDRKKGVCIHFL